MTDDPKTTNSDPPFSFIALAAIAGFLLLASIMLLGLLDEARRDGFDDGVFWGYRAAMEQGVTGSSALVTAYKMRQKAEQQVREKEAELKKLRRELK